MRRAIRFLGLLIAAIAVLVLLSISAALLWASRNSDHPWVARLVPRLTSGELVVRDLSGNLLASPRFATVEIRDPQGVWAIVHNLRIDWSPLKLAGRDVRLKLFSAGRIHVRRRPVFAESTGKSSWYGFRLDIDKLAVGELVLAPPVIGVPAALNVDGSLHMPAPDAGKIAMALASPGGAGVYRASANFSPKRIDATFAANEPGHGLIARVAKVPAVGPLLLEAAIAGPKSVAATTLSLRAGQLRANARGEVDLERGALDFDLTASAPAMAPRADLGWRSVALDAHARGAFAAPSVSGTLRVAGLDVAGGGIAQLDADLRGSAGQVALRARAERVRVPGPDPDLLGAAPVMLRADARLDATARPLTFAMSHPLLALTGQLDTAGPIRGTIAAHVPGLAPYAKLVGLDLQGHAVLDARFAVSDSGRQLDLNGGIGITGGQPQAVALIGQNGRIALGASMRDDTITLSRLHLEGRAIEISAQGSLALASRNADLAWKVALGDLRAAAPTLAGRLAAEGRLHGTPTDLALAATASGEVGGKGAQPGPLRFEAALTGLPSAPTGRVRGQGVLAGAPLVLALDLSRSPSGAIRAVIDRAAWRSAQAEGTLTLAPRVAVPEGRIAVRIARLQDFRPFLGEPIGGTIEAVTQLTRAGARVRATMQNLRLPGTADVASAELNGRVTGLMAHPVVDARLTATGLRAGAISGAASIDARGPEDRLAVQFAAKLTALAGAPAAISSTGVIDVASKTATLASLQATWKGAALRLLAPAALEFGQTASIRHLRLGLERAVLEASGQIAPTLDFRLTASNVTANLARLVEPGLRAQGTLNAEGRLSGTIAQPRGTARLTAAGVRLASGPGLALPAADLSATATLDRRAARIEARLTAGTATRLRLAGSVPLAPAGALDVRATGGIDLAMLNPLTSAQGILVRGRLALDLGIAGAPRAPALAGTMLLSGGDVQDFAQGIHLAAVRAVVRGQGNMLGISEFSARAGQGFISGTGTVGVLAPGIPVNLQVAMSDAKPLASNLVAATVDARVALVGNAERQLRVAGAIRIRKAEISVPEHMPQSVSVLPVRIAGQPPPPPPAPGPDIALDVSLTAARQIYVRGRGLNAELGGHLHLGGAAKHPLPTGAFRMIRGQYSIAGTTLNFTEGSISFTGQSNVAGGNRIDPALNFVATSSSATVTATLTVGGFASNPKITLSSVPELPQDEVLAQLLFGQSIKNLSPFQIAEIASTLAEISGLGGVGIGDPLNRLRNSLGLDRLTIGTNPVNPAVTPGTQQNNANTVVQAGRYVAPGVYLGAKQGIVGGSEQTQATLQVDVTKHLKLETGAGSGQGANNIGLTYQFQY